MVDPPSSHIRSTTVPRLEAGRTSAMVSSPQILQSAHGLLFSFATLFAHIKDASTRGAYHKCVLLKDNRPFMRRLRTSRGIISAARGRSTQTKCQSSLA